MKNLLISTSIAALMASNSMVSFASSVPNLNTFVTGTPAVAAEVNDNFTDVANSVDDNDGRITINEQAITDLGGAPTCPSDMVAVGSSSLCVDLYEASVYPDDTLTANTQLNPDAAIDRCDIDGSDCGKDSADAANTAIYAGSVKGVLPNRSVSWHQAVQACNNVGKRLPTTAEWQLAAAGTPPGPGNGTDGCNNGGTNPLVETGNAATCVSNVGAFDMVGNLAEWNAELHTNHSTSGSGAGFTETSSVYAWALGGTKTGPASASTTSVFVAGSATNQNAELGFRCVK